MRYVLLLLLTTPIWGQLLLSSRTLVYYIAQVNNAANILIEHQLQLPLNMATVDQERELHKPNG